MANVKDLSLTILYLKEFHQPPGLRWNDGELHSDGTQMISNPMEKEDAVKFCAAIQNSEAATRNKTAFSIYKAPTPQEQKYVICANLNEVSISEAIISLLNTINDPTECTCWEYSENGDVIYLDSPYNLAGEIFNYLSKDQVKQQLFANLKTLCQRAGIEREKTESLLASIVILDKEDVGTSYIIPSQSVPDLIHILAKGTKERNEYSESLQVVTKKTFVTNESAYPSTFLGKKAKTEKSEERKEGEETKEYKKPLKS